MNFFRKIFFTVLLMTTQVSIAAEPSTTDPVAQPVAAATKAPGSFFGSMEKSVTVLMSKLSGSLNEKLLTSGIKFAAKLTGWSLEIGGGLALLYIIYEGIGIMSGKNSSIQMLVVEAAVPMAFSAYLINNYSQLISETAGPGGFLDNIRTIAGDPTVKILQMYGSLLQLVTTTITSACDTFFKTVSIFNMGPAMLAGFDATMTILFALVVIGLALKGMTEILGLLLMGPFLGAVGIAFGPFFIAGLVTPWTREYFTKWLGFVVASAVLTGVLGVCISISSELFIAFNFESYSQEATPSATLMLFLAIVIMTINSLIQQAPSIANALVPGSFGVSKGSGMSIQEMGKNASNRASSAAQDAKRMMTSKATKNTSTPNIKTPWGDAN